MKTAEVFTRTPLISKGGSHFTPLMQSEFDYVLYHHGFEKQDRGSNSPHVKYTHHKTGRVVTVKPRRVFSSDNIDRISKDVTREVGHQHLRHPANWNPKNLRGVPRGELVALREEKDDLPAEELALREAKKQEIAMHTEFAERMKKLATREGGRDLPSGVSQIRGFRLAAAAFRKARKAQAALKRDV